MVATSVLKRGRAGRLCVLATAAMTLFALACAPSRGPRPAPRPQRVDAIRVSDVARDGDPTRRASTRLVLDGLAQRPPENGVASFERAIQIDPTNPWAYLALAGYEVQWGDRDRGVQYLAQADLLLASEGQKSPRVEPHLIGLRGRAQLRVSGGGNVAAGEELLAQARELSPDVWGDGWLGASELR
jgi:hypothetical protein